MAGRVRHPIDMRALERWIEKNIPEIEVPLEIKQVRSSPPVPPPTRRDV